MHMLDNTTTSDNCTGDHNCNQCRTLRCWVRNLRPPSPALLLTLTQPQGPQQRQLTHLPANTQQLQVTMHKPTPVWRAFGCCCRCNTTTAHAHSPPTHRHHMVSRQPTLCPPRSQADGTCATATGHTRHTTANQHSLQAPEQQYTFKPRCTTTPPLPHCLLLSHRKAQQHSWLSLWPQPQLDSSTQLGRTATLLLLSSNSK